MCGIYRISWLRVKMKVTTYHILLLKMEALALYTITLTLQLSYQLQVA